MSLLVVFVCGYGLASFQATRAQLQDEINDYPNEIAIASKLLTLYSEQCEGAEQTSFSPYVQHATTRYQLLVNKADKFPYFLDQHFVENHLQSASEFNQLIQSSRNHLFACSKS
ncbi:MULTISPECIES: hypothetical protein [Shewanella]|nr:MULTISPECIES: hypothetical protein [Shewanella]